MNCRSASRLIPLHAGEDLLPDQVAELELHLVGCAACAEEFASFQGLRELVSSVREPVLETSLWDALDSRLDAVDATRRMRRPWFRSPWLYSTAAAVLMLAFLPPWVPSRGGVEPAGGAGAEPVVPVVVASPSEADDLQYTPGHGPPLFGPGLQRVPREDLDRFLRDSAGFRQTGGSEAGLVASPVGHRSSEF